MADRCSFCGSTTGRFSRLEGLFTVLMCADCQAARGHGTGPYPVMTQAEMRAGLDLLPTWAWSRRPTTSLYQLRANCSRCSMAAAVQTIARARIAISASAAVTVRRWLDSAWQPAI
jgi:hypothetical protein